MPERVIADVPSRTALATAAVHRAGQLASSNAAPLVQSNAMEEFVVDLVCWEYEPGTAWVWQFLHWTEADYALKDVWPPQAVLNAVRVDVLSRGLRVQPGPPFSELGLGPVTGSHLSGPKFLVTAYDGGRPGLQLYRAEYQDRRSARAAEIWATSEELVGLAADKNEQAWRARGL